MKKYLFFLGLSIFVFSNPNFTIWSEGIGNTKQIAKKDALNALSQQIIAKINSTQTSTKKSINGNIISSFESNITTKSDVLLKGIKYQYKEKNDLYYARALLDYEALDISIKYLMSKIDPKNIGSTRKYNEKKLKEFIQICNFANALLYYPKVPEIYPNFKEFTKIISKQLDQTKKRLNGYSSIEISTNVNNASITIDGKEYKTNEEIFLKAGKYSLYMKKDSYKNIKATFRLESGEYLEKKVDFIKKIKSKIPVQISINGTDDFYTKSREFKKVLYKYNMQISNKSDLQLKFFYEEDIKKSGVFINTSANMELEIYKNTNLIKKYTSSKKFKASKKSFNDKKKANIIHLLKKLTRRASTHF